MTTPKKFSASSDESREAPTEPFELEGVYAKGRTGPDGATTWSETYEVSTQLGAAAAQWYTSAYVMLEGKQQINPPAVIEFIRLACIPESALRFQALIDDPDRLVDVKPLGEVFVWLSEEVLARPTAPPS
jgi:hypothetical protein